MVGDQPDVAVVRHLDQREAAGLYEDLVLPAGTARPYTVINMVQTLDGKTSVGGRSTPIGSTFDRLLLRRLRAAAEGVMIGAGTLRAEEIEFRFPPALLAKRLEDGLPPALTAVVVSASGELPLQRRLFSVPTPDVVPVVLTAQCADAAALRQLAGRARVLVMGEGRVDLPTAMGFLVRELGVHRLVLEGGPTLNAEMLTHDLVDEIFCTVAPKVLGGPATTMVAGRALLPGWPRQLKLVSALAFEDELFLRYRVRA